MSFPFFKKIRELCLKIASLIDYTYHLSPNKKKYINQLVKFYVFSSEKYSIFLKNPVFMCLFNGVGIRWVHVYYSTIRHFFCFSEFSQNPKTGDFFFFFYLVFLCLFFKLLFLNFILENSLIIQKSIVKKYNEDFFHEKVLNNNHLPFVKTFFIVIMMSFIKKTIDFSFKV